MDGGDKDKLAVFIIKALSGLCVPPRMVKCAFKYAGNGFERKKESYCIAVEVDGTEIFAPKKLL